MIVCRERVERSMATKKTGTVEGKFKVDKLKPEKIRSKS